MGTNCYLLSECGTTAHCEGCVSGPTTPDVSTCPWPPGPTPPTTSSTTTSTTPSTTQSTTPSTTTSSTTTSTTESTTESTTPSTTSTTTETTTKSTTKSTTTSTTTQSQGSCDDIHINEECDWDYGLVQWYEHVMTGAECQDICKNVAGAKYFSHYNEGHQGEHGFCGCFSQCWPSTEGCRATCSSHETHEFESREDLMETADEDLDSAEVFGVELDVEHERAKTRGAILPLYAWK